MSLINVIYFKYSLTLLLFRVRNLRPMPVYIRNLLLAFLLLSAQTSFAQPTASFSYTMIPSTGCAPVQVQFNAGIGPTYGNPTSFNWVGIPNVPITNSSPSIIWNTPGTYTVTLIVSNSSGQSQPVTKTITVYGAPTVAFTGSPLSGCPVLNVTLDGSGSTMNAPGGGTFTWITSSALQNITNGSPATVQFPSGLHNVTLQVTNSKGCQASLTKTNYVNVYPKPEVDFSTPVTTFCSAPTPSLTFTSLLVNTTTGPYSYSWDMGQAPNQIQSTTNAVKSYGPPPSGSYTVKLVVTDGNGCKDTMIKPQYINIVDVHASFTAPSSACIQTPVVFTATGSPSGGNCAWDFGVGETPDVGPTVTHYFATSGTKTVRLVYSFGPCSDTVYKSITIFPKPTIDFTYIPNPPCPAPITLTFTATGAASYQWNFGDGPGMTNGNGVSHLYTTCGNYTPTLYATDGNGCKDTLAKVEYVKINCGELRINSSKFYGCAPLTVNFNADLDAYIYYPFYQVFPYPYAIASYQWKFGSAGTSSAAAPQFTFTSCGKYEVSLKVTTVNGCVFTDTIPIYVGAKPTSGFNSDTSVCSGQPIHFSNTTVFPTGCPGDPIYEYEWTFGDNKGFTYIPDPTYKYDTAGTFCVQLISKFNGCADTAKKCNIRVDSSVSNWKPQYNCDTPLKVKFNNASYGYTSLIWYFGDGPASTSTLDNPVHTYSSYGSYTVRLVTFNSRSGCSDTENREIILMNPTPVLTVDDSTICKDEDIRLNAVYINPSYPTATYFWYINNVLVNHDSAVNYTDTFNVEGYYKIKVIMMDAMGCYDSVVKNNWILVSKPFVNFTATPTSGCVPLTVNFTDLSQQVPPPINATYPGAPLVNRQWTFGPPGGTASLPGNTASYTYWDAGAFDVKVIVTDASGCKDSITKPQYIQSWKPAADFTVDDVTSCVNTTLTFTNLTTTITSAKWFFGDGDTSIAISPQHEYKQPGTYTVMMIATDAHGCKDTAINSSYITITRPKAVLSISDTMAVCPPLVDTFDANGSVGAASYWWDFQTGNNPIAPHVIEPFMTAGKYNILLVAKDANGCTDTAKGTVYILGYAGAFDYTPLSGCAPLEVSFHTSLNNIPSVIWDFNDGNTAGSVTNTIKHVYTVPGAYVPKMIMTDGNGCTSSSGGIDTIKVDGVEAKFTHSPACEGYLVTLKDASKSMFTPLITWSWAFHDGSVSSVKEPTHYYPSAGTYKVVLIATNSKGCRDTLDSVLVIHELPVIDAGKDTVICLKDAAQLNASGGVSYVWAPATTLSCSNCANPLASPADTMLYTVIGTDANQCSDTDAVVVKVKYKVTAGVAEGGEICDGESTILKVWGAQTYVWSPDGDLDNKNLPEPVASPRYNTIFKVVSYEGSCIPDTDFVEVTVHPKPIVRASGSATIIAGNDAPINAEGEGIRTFLWQPSETLNCSDCPNPIAKPIRTTIYTIIGATEYGCKDSADVTVTVLCDQSQLFIPNTFTPNGDGQNDIFYPRGVGFDALRSFRVYNRWGEVVFERSKFPLNDKASGWDGTFKGQQLPPDVFVYTVEADCENGDVIKWKGDVTLVR